MIQSNFSKLALFTNQRIMVRKNIDTYIFTMPTIAFENSMAYNFNFFLGCCSADLSELKSPVSNIKFESRYDFMKAICKSNRPEAIDIIACLGYIVQDFEYVEDSFYCGESEIDEEVFNLMCIYVSIACGAHDFKYLEEQRQLDDMDPIEREWEMKKRENEKKLRKAKEKAGKGIGIDLIIASVMREFHVSLHDAVNMNKYGLIYLYSLIGKIANYEVTKIAAGTGNLSKKSKHEYWANR